MRIDVKVIPSAKKNQISLEATPVKVYLTAHALDGKANQALVGFLAEYYKVAKGRISITKGLKTRYKTITIEGI